MASVLNKELFSSALTKALALVESEFDALNALDAATGDGDHGTAIKSTLEAAVAAAAKPGSLAETLSNVAMDVMSATGGSTSSLYGSFFMGMSSGVAGEELTASQTAAAFASGLDMLCTMTNAKVGDKTMMDAMIPAIESMKANADSATLAELFDGAAKAAKDGAAKTSEYVAKFGRARNLGERSKGSCDAGATSLALIFQAFADVAK